MKTFHDTSMKWMKKDGTESVGGTGFDCALQYKRRTGIE